MQAIRTLQERRQLIQNFEQDFRERMQGTWVSAETRQMFDPIFYIHIMPDSVRRVYIIISIWNPRFSTTSRATR